MEFFKIDKKYLVPNFEVIIEILICNLFYNGDLKIN
jgi:hypothetical protein